ncbi:MAG: hypothetical protein GF418_16010 [Chitinivibrionales bacterium]|nr:hypothetical protein [Chitinivibrionales bacterium]
MNVNTPLANASQLLTSEVAALPRSRGNVPFQSFVKSLNDAFLSCIEPMSGSDRVTTWLKANASAIEALADRVLRTIETYMDGNPHAAYQKLAEWLADSEHLGHLITPAVSNAEVKQLYRMRRKGSRAYSSRDMFHVPLELRGRVRTQRYSIPGFPCLYAGSSVFICWQELGMPNLDEVVAVRLEPQCSLSFLDFSITPRALGEFLAVDTENHNHLLFDLAVAYLAFWPIIAACSVEAAEPEAPFKPEYIIPQIVLQFIKNRQGIHGIRYFSTSTQQGPPSFQLGTNYVFPVQTIGENGLCDVLVEFFHATVPMAWQLASTIRWTNEAMPGVPVDERVELIPGNPVRYGDTAFATMEAQLNRLRASRVLPDYARL